MILIATLALAVVVGCAGLITHQNWTWYLGGDAPVEFPLVATLGNEDSLEVAHYDLIAKQAAGKGLWVGLCDVGEANVTLSYAGNRVAPVQTFRGGRHVSMKEWGIAKMRPLAVDHLSKGGDLPVTFTNEGMPATLVVGVVEDGTNPDLLLAECPTNTMGFTVGDAIRRTPPPTPPVEAESP